MRDRKKPAPRPLEDASKKAPATTSPAEEWGERVDLGRQIAQGGREKGGTPGSTGDDPHDPRAGKTDGRR